MAEKIAEAESNKWPIVKTIEQTLFKYRATPHSTTGVSPFEAMFGRPMRDKLTLLAPAESDRIRENESETTVSVEEEEDRTNTQSLRQRTRQRAYGVMNEKEATEDAADRAKRKRARIIVNPPVQKKDQNPVQNRELSNGPRLSGNRQL